MTGGRLYDSVFGVEYPAVSALRQTAKLFEGNPRKLPSQIYPKQDSQLIAPLSQFHVLLRAFCYLAYAILDGYLDRSAVSNNGANPRTALVDAAIDHDEHCLCRIKLKGDDTVFHTLCLLNWAQSAECVEVDWLGIAKFSYDLNLCTCRFFLLCAGCQNEEGKQCDEDCPFHFVCFKGFFPQR